MAGAMNVSFDKLNKRLFVDAVNAFTSLGYQAAIQKFDPANPVLIVTKGAAKAELPISKNILTIGDRTMNLEGLVVLADKLDKVYVPQQAIDLVKANLK
jgi:alkaline phosphatase